jgi:hypothetical protein
MLVCMFTKSMTWFFSFSWRSNEVNACAFFERGVWLLKADRLQKSLQQGT